MKLWIARDFDGGLYLYSREPIKEDDFFYSSYESIPLSENMFPEVTFENSPQEVELKLLNSE